MAGGSTAAAYYAAIANAIKASGAIIEVTPDDFLKIIARSEKPVVVTATGGVFSKSYQYLSGYKGLILYTKHPLPLMLPGSAEVITAKKIWIPG
jgi:uracil DNA glycosylase